jgi:hypothetical protein
MKTILFALLICLTISGYSQFAFEPEKFTQLENTDSIFFDLDIEFNIEHPYAIERMNVKLDSSRLLTKRLKIPKHFHSYGMYVIRQDSLHDFYIVLETNDRANKKVINYGFYSARICLYVFHKVQKEFTDTIVLAEKSFWANSINSGDVLDIKDNNSIVFFNEKGKLKIINRTFYDRKLHSSYAFNIPHNLYKPKKSTYIWLDCKFQKGEDSQF